MTWTWSRRPIASPRQHQLLLLFNQLGPDEQRVVIATAQRILDGRKIYGELNLSTDPRHFPHEESEELLDAQIYKRIEELRKR